MLSKSKTILVIGMFDSVHFYRWLEQFKNQDLHIIILPSKPFRNVHENLRSLISENRNFSFASNFYRYKFCGYIDFFLSKILFRSSYRVRLLNAVLKSHNFHRIHALEIQGAGYLCLDWSTKYKSKFLNNLIITNWGSDIYFFMHNSKHLDKIKRVLSIASFYSAECIRDYDLAVKLGYKAEFLDCNPNSGGVQFENSRIITPASERDLILIKGYGGLFGEANLAVSAISLILEEFPKLKIFYYSVTKDIAPLIVSQKKIFKNSIDYSAVDSRIPYDEMLDKFRSAKVYIGISKSDGISTSFIEALCAGAYPIQSNTSCANEWVNKGIRCTLVDLSVDQIKNAILSILENPDLLDSSVLNNLEISREHLNYEKVLTSSLKFYE